jgi:hypothetical protein
VRTTLLIAACVAAMLVAHTALLADGVVSVWPDQGPTLSHSTAWLGNTGLIFTPTAYAGGARGASASWHRINRDPESLDVANVNFSFQDTFEVGGSLVDGGGIGDNELLANAKWVVPAARWLKNEDFPALAIGAIDLTNETNRAYYLVLSKLVPFGNEPSGNANLSLSLGFADNHANGGALDGLFAGAEFAGFKNTVVQAEYDGDAFNADLRWRLSERFGADVGVMDGDLGFGVTYAANY